jgi:hypothetical protein
MGKQIVNDKEVQIKIGEILDDLAAAVKKAARGVFDLMVDKTANSAENVLDKGVDNLKQKIGKDVNDEQKN